MSSHSWLFAPKSEWDKRPSLAHLVRMVPPTEMALILAMTDVFPEKVKRKMVDMMIRHYLTRVRNAMKSKVFSRIKVLKMMSLSIFMTCEADHYCLLLDDLKFRWLRRNHVEPIHLVYANLQSCPIHFLNKYEFFRTKYELSCISMMCMHTTDYYYPKSRFNSKLLLSKYDKLYTYITDDEEPIKDDEKPIYDYKELLRSVKPKMVVSVKKKDRFPPQKKLPPPRKFSFKGGW